MFSDCQRLVETSCDEITGLHGYRSSRPTEDDQRSLAQGHKQRSGPERMGTRPVHTDVTDPRRTELCRHQETHPEGAEVSSL